MVLYYAQTLLTGLFIIIIIYINLKNSVNKIGITQKLFIAELFANGMLLVFELLLNLFNGGSLPYTREILTTILVVFYSLNPVVGYIWVLYLHSLIQYKKISFQKTAVILGIPIIINIILNVVSIFIPLMYAIDVNNIFSRGPFFMVLVFVSIINPFISFVLILFSRKSIKKEYIKTLLFFTVIPFASGILQSLFFGVSFLWPCTALANLLVYMDINAKIIASSRQAEAANEAKNIFLARTSHELRNPMHGIKGSADLLAKTNLDGEQKKYLGYIQESANVLLHLINDLLDISQLEADRLELSKKELNINNIINLVLNNMSSIAEDKGINLYVDVQEKLPIFIGDPTRIYQIIMNLVQNAIKFTDHGEVSIKVYIDKEEERRCNLKFEIKDTGIGMVERDIELIFNKFTQLDRSISKRLQGIGMGLAIVQQLVEKMQGNIKVESKLGVGSNFIVSIWLEKNISKKEAAKDIEHVGLNNNTNHLPILIVEDNIKINQEIVKTIIKSINIESVSVSDGFQAVSAAEQNQFSLILMDCHMPVMDGYEATVKIRELEKSKDIHTPIIAMTADAMEENQKLCLAVGMDDYILKPFDKKELIEKINYWLNYK